MSIRESNLALSDPNATFNCPTCERPDDNESQMVFCDHCQRWYHFGCQGVTSAAKEDSDWICAECREDTSKEDPEEKELEEAVKALALEKERHRKRLEKRMELAKLKQKLEIENREMEWACEKSQLEMRIAAEEKFNRKRQVEKDALQQKLDKLLANREESDSKVEDKSRKTKKVENKERSENKVPASSTPIGNPGLSRPNISRIGSLSRRSEGQSTKDTKESKKDKGDGSGSDIDADELSEASENSEESSDETEESESDPKDKRTEPQAPTKAQLSARQFLSRKLPTFTGKPDEWPLFISSFETTTKACGFSNLENLARLQECLKGSAREAVCSRLLLPEAVPHIIETLRMLYGRPEQLLQMLMLKVRKTDPPKADRLESFISFGLIVQQLCDHLEATNLKDHLVNPMLVQELVDKLPANTKLEWIWYKRARSEVTLRTLADFLSEFVSAASEVSSVVDVTSQSSRPGKAKAGKTKEHEGFVYTHSGSGSQPADKKSTRTPCPCCDQIDHRLRNCEKFRCWEIPKRIDAVKRWELCPLCLNNHGKASCRLNIVCKVESCKEKEEHNTLLHPLRSELRSNCNIHTIANQQTIIFRMLPVTLSYGNRSMNVVAFLDEGSSYTLVDSSVVKTLKASGISQPLRITWTAGMSRLERDSKQLDLLITAQGSSDSFLIENAHSVEKLKLPEQTLRCVEIAARYDHLQGLPLIDYVKESPKILIGLKHLHLFAPLESRVGKPGEPIAVRSKLGWTVYGPQQGVECSMNFVGHHMCTGVTNQELHDLLKAHYLVEEAGLTVDLIPESKEDKRARDIMEKTTIRIGDRYQTGMLWKEEDTKFPDSYPMAVRRMKSLQKRLCKDPELLDIVRKQLIEYQQKQYCHKATEEELLATDPEKVWYLPLNIVLNPKKPGKVRLVWDAAAAVNGVSLNSKLLKGPDFLTSLPSVVSQFREHLIGFGGDVKEMFHQLMMRPEDKQALRFLFEGEVYVMDCAIFGATCSPSQALYVKDENAKEFSVEFPDAAEAIIKKTYVDDYYDSTTTVGEAVKRAKEVRYIHSKAGFEIRNWVSNSKEFLHEMGEPKEDQVIHLSLDEKSGSERVLGIVWSTVEDVFTFCTQLRSDLLPYLFEEKRPTKRIVLSSVMSLFDPLGLLAHFTIHGKILIQDLWRTGCSWDEPIDDECYEKWKRWTGCLPAVGALKIPRYYFGDGLALDFQSLQLHVFVDASVSAYGAVSYFRILSGGVPRCSLVQAKSKVSPLKPHSIPRLELMAAVLGARMVDCVKQNHTLPISRIFLWTDSETVYRWIISDHRKYKIFVALRIGDILSRTAMEDWRWVGTKLNIADGLTKWNSGLQLESNSPWYNGPKFLYESEKDWPTKVKAEPNVGEELRPAFLFHKAEILAPLIDVSRISKWSILVRTIAYVVRFVSNLKKKVQKQIIETLPVSKKVSSVVLTRIPGKEKALERDEFVKAEQILWKMAQGDAFTEEIRLLHNCRDDEGRRIPYLEKSSVLYKLSPIIDEYGVVRMEGRLAMAADIPFEQRFPIILPRNHLITTMLLDHYHRNYGHASRETIVNELRQRFYIPNIRAELRKVMRNCMWCKVYKCYPVIPRMAPLPQQRLTPFLRPFSYTGVDFFGPIVVTVGRHSEKRWVSLFTCFNTRAIHLEVAHSLSSQACIMAIRRFVCRRGMPHAFFSDNGTNFIGANKELMKEIERDCNEAFTDARTSWHFNPPLAPHMGGAWERLVRSVKQAMKVLDDGRKLTDEVLLTTLAEAENIVNSRPLTYAPQESANGEALTPNHFIRGLPSKGVEQYQQSTDQAEALRNTYKRSQLLADELWKKWIVEYLPTINRRSKWYAEQRSIKQGDIVFVADSENRRHWIRGIVEKVIQGIDGRIRQAVVRTAKGSYRRPVSKLAVPEFENGNSSFNPGSPPELRGGAVAAPLGTTVQLPAGNNP